MTDKGDSRASQARATPMRLSETEGSRLLQDAARQYEEYMRLADLADISETSNRCQPRYAWDNPIGLVITRRTNARLV